MFDLLRGASPHVTAARSDALLPPGTDDLRDALERLAVLDGAGLAESEMIDQLAALERLKGAVAAAQSRVTVSLVRARTRREASEGVPANRRCQGLASEIALARRCSPHRGARGLGIAKALVDEMPRTLDALTRGKIPEWRATLVVRETAVLTRAHREQVDRELGDRLPGPGDRAAAAEARRIGYRLDPGSALRRTRGAEADRYVSLRPAPDTMTHLTVLLPVAQGVACQAALRTHAESLRAPGRHPQPKPDHGRHPGRTRHRTGEGDGGETTAENGQGLCEACNYAKEAAGWRVRSIESRRHLEVTTPTGHAYVSTMPDPPGTSPPECAEPSPLEERCRALVA